MFSSQRVVAKNSDAYKAWLAGMSRKQLKRQDLDVDLDLIIASVSQLGVNFQAISLCTLGIVRIHHGKVSILLSDCQRASEMAKGINMTVVKKKKSVLPNIENLKNLVAELDEETCYVPSQSQLISKANPTNITIKDNLPMIPFTVSNFEDFGNEGLLDFDVSLSQGIFQETPVKEMNDVREMEEEHGGDDFDLPNNDDYEAPINIEEETPDLKMETFVDQHQPVENFEILASDDNDAQISVVNNKVDEPQEEMDSRLDLSSLRSYGSETKKRRRKRKSLFFDEVTTIPQIEMRHNMDDYSDLVNSTGIIAPPTQNLMKIQQNDWSYLLMNCHVEGLKSKKSPVAKFINSLCEQAMNSKTKKFYQVPDNVSDVLDVVENQRFVDNNEEMNHLPAGNVDEIGNVQKWLEEVGEEPERMDIDFEVGSIEIPREEPIINQVIDHDIVPFEELLPQNEEFERPAKRRKLNEESENDSGEEENKNASHIKFLKNLETLTVSSLEKVTFNDILQKISKSRLTRKVVAREFMTMLELKKLRKIEVFQEKPNDPIVLKITTEC
ncbi:unnamed protein product [Caenorhabditis angaria]|uniref:Rad21/Rec8-like protein N-terminal domain-containing protein n=1 Tax=Caenorhabditis angaria TaxID=860376 RepID=A0A9P1IBW0_9PELO|nr:unnamed protein product [Caenorhabditis angaria]